MNWGSFWLENKKIILSCFVALLIIGAGILSHEGKSIFSVFASLGTKKSAEAVLPPDLVTPTATNITNRDTDNDGLTDWEERLHGADPENPDTDSDGTNDGDEIRNGRDPIKPGPNDLLPVIADPNFATSSTDVLGLKKEFFAKYLAAQAQDIRETTFRDLIKNFDAKKYRTTYQIIDLNVSSDNSIEAMRTYGNAFGVLIERYTKRTHRTEEEILGDALPAKNSKTLQELQLPAITYRNFSKDLIVLRVPSSLAEHHLSIVNGYDGMSKGLLGLQKLFLDPVEGGGAYQVYTTQRLNVTQGYAGIVASFHANGVTFSPEELGYPFYRIYAEEEVGTTSL